MAAPFTPARATETVPCPLCGSPDYQVIATGSDYEYYLPGEFHVARCVQCRLLFQNPRPPYRDIMRYYTERYAPYRKVGSAAMRRVRHAFLIRPKIRELEQLAPRGARVLDVGCSTGEFIAELARETSWKIEGIEPKIEAAQIGIDHGLTIHPVTLEQAKLLDGQYDLITMNHVLEHVPNPREIAAITYRLLKPGGYFYGVLPCSDCLERTIFGRYWQGYHLPRHLTWFSKKQLAAFLGSFGFTDIRCAPQPQISNWQVSLKNMLFARGSDARKIEFLNGHSLPLYFMTFPFVVLIALFGRAPIQKFIARKPRENNKKTG